MLFTTALFWVLPLLAQTLGIQGQDFAVPSNWVNTTSQISRADRISLAQSGLQRVKELQNTKTGEFNGFAYWVSPGIVEAFAMKDYIAGTQNNEFIVDGLKATASLHPLFNATAQGSVDNPLSWAMACIYAYRVYGDDQLLQFADAVWTEAQKYVITASNVRSGTHPEKNITFSGTCNGESLEGGVFYQTQRNDMRLACISTALHVIVSAYLGELTNNSKYLNAAITSAKFIQKHIINEDGLAVGMITPSTSDSCERDESLEIRHTGWVFEGLSILADLTSDSLWRDLAMNVITAAPHYGIWYSGNGVIQDASKGDYMRSFWEPYRRNANNVTVQDYIQSYINVQYNALITYATRPGSDLYASDWQAGPPPTTFDPDGAAKSLGLLVMGIVGADSSDPSSSPSATATPVPVPAPTSTEQASDKHSNASVIAVGIATPVAILLLALFLFLMWKRRRSRRSNVLPHGGVEDKVAAPPAPYLSQPFMRYAEPVLPIGAQYQTHDSVRAAMGASSSTPPYASFGYGITSPTWQSHQAMASADLTPGSDVNNRGLLAAAAGRREKGVLRTTSPGLAQPAASGLLGDERSSSTARAGASEAQQSPRSGLIHEGLTTEELVHALNARLQTRESASQDESPPEYREVGARR